MYIHIYIYTYSTVNHIALIITLRHQSINAYSDMMLKNTL